MNGQAAASDERLEAQLETNALLSAQNVLLSAQNVLLTAILGELQGWRQPQAGPAECPHPPDVQEDLSSMGEKWIRCRGCGADLVRKERS